MHFLPDVYVTCEECKGKRYNRETLDVTFKDKSIADVLDMTVEEGAEFFKAVPSIRDKLETLARVGLGYIHIGQQATTLSGGEAQRIKLSKELSRRATGRTLYILDEPTTGLHFHDVAKLLEVLHELADAGNTVVVIEHNLEVIKTADWIIDLGPEGGDGGGTIVAAGHARGRREGQRELHGAVSEAGAYEASEGSEQEAGGGVVRHFVRTAMTDDGLFTIASRYPVAETMQRLVAAVTERNMLVFGRIDHSEGAARAGMSLRPTVLLIFGHPKGGTPLMQERQTAGIRPAD